MHCQYRRGAYSRLLQERRPRVLVEQIGASHVATQRIYGLVPADLHHLEHRGTCLRRTGEEARAQRLTGEVHRIEADTFGVRLHDLRGAVRHERHCLHALTLQHGAEHRSCGDLGGGEPGLHGLDGAQLVASGDRDLLALPFLVGLAAADCDAQPVRRLGQIGDLQRAEFTPPERTGKAEGQQRAVPLAGERVGAER